MSYNYYELLNIPPNASQEDVEQAYKSAQETYAFSNQAIKEVFTEEESVMFLKIVEEAYQVLGNCELRKIYDEKTSSSSGRTEEVVSEMLLIIEDLQKKQLAEQAKPPFVRDEVFEIEISSCSNWTGSMLKRLREYKQLTAENVYEKTKINPWYVTAVEDMDAHNLPAPVFVRGYVVQIAKLFGLNEKLVADTYMKNFNLHNGHKA